MSHTHPIGRERPYTAKRSLKYEFEFPSNETRQQIAYSYSKTSENSKVLFTIFILKWSKQ